MEFNHVRAAYKISWKHKPCKGSFGKWQYPSTKDVLKECGLYSIEEYLQTRSTGIAMYVVDRPLYLECSEGGRRRGSMLHQQWWEQELGLDVCYVKFAAGSTQLAGRRWVCQLLGQFGLDDGCPGAASDPASIQTFVELNGVKLFIHYSFDDLPYRL